MTLDQIDRAADVWIYKRNRHKTWYRGKRRMIPHGPKARALLVAFMEDLRRVIYVAPYLSILEQNAAVVRSALGLAPDDPDLFEHHSLADLPADDREDVRETAARRAENCDAPLLVTANVQFLESLFANRPGWWRELHNVARSAGAA